MHGFETEMRTLGHFSYKMVHCKLWDWYIVGFVRQVCDKRPWIMKLYIHDVSFKQMVYVKCIFQLCL